MTDWLAHHRIMMSRIFTIFAGLALLFTQHSWVDEGVFDVMTEVVGYGLLITATFLRLWCALYIYGYKGHSLVQSGPYSMVRNPLYVASLLGAFGLGFASENLLFLALLIFFFVFYYPWVVINEEKELSAAHGEVFKDYCKRVPRFIPKFSLFTEPERYEIHPRRVRRAFLDAMWFLWAMIGFEIIERLHEANILPTLWYIP